MNLPENLKKKRDELAEKSINPGRDLLELHEADARVRHFKWGFDAGFEYQRKEIECLRLDTEHIQLINNEYFGVIQELKSRIMSLEQDLSFYKNGKQIKEIHFGELYEIENSISKQRIEKLRAALFEIMEADDSFESKTFDLAGIAITKDDKAAGVK